MVKKMEEDLESGPIRGRQRRINEAEYNDYCEKVLNDRKPRYTAAKDALQCMMCPPPDPTFPSLHKIDCVLNQCVECKQYDVPEREARLADNDPHIRFHWYDTLLSCINHGMRSKYPPLVEGQGKVQTKTCPYCDTEEAQAQAAGKEYD